MYLLVGLKQPTIASG